MLTPARYTSKGLLGRLVYRRQFQAFYTSRLGLLSSDWPEKVAKNDLLARVQEEKPKFIILDSSSSRLLPKRRPDLPKSETVKVNFLDDQRKKLLIFESNEDTALQSIRMMRPTNLQVSDKRYEQLIQDLQRAFSARQLREFIISQPEHRACPKSATKTNLVQRIVDDIWALRVDPNTKDSSDLIVEQSINLPYKSMFLLLTDNGRIPRLWTRRGAQVVMLTEEQRIVVRSSRDTFDWIHAYLHRFLSRACNADIDLSFAISSSSCIQLDLIQKLSETYLITHIDRPGYFLATAMSQEKIKQCERLLIASLDLKKPAAEVYLYPHVLENKEVDLVQICDPDSLSWNQRAKPWYRAVYTCSAEESKDIALKPFSGSSSSQSNELNAVQSPTSPSTLTKTIQSIRQALEDVVQANGDMIDFAFTAAPGFILHTPEVSDAAYVSAKGTDFCSWQKAFLFNVPRVKSIAHTLPLYEQDIDFESCETQTMSDSSETTQSTTYASDSAPMTTQSCEEDLYTYLVQITLVPSPLLATQNSGNPLPHVEIWLQVENGGPVMESAQLVSAENEYSIYVSLPHFSTDLKFDATKVVQLDAQSSYVTDFLNDCHFNFSSSDGQIKVPDSLNIERDGQLQEYRYQSLVYRRQLEVNYKGRILQLSDAEGGLFSGRRTEAHLVHMPQSSESQSDQLTRFVTDSLDLVEACNSQI